MTLHIGMIANYLPAPANWGSTLRVHHLARGLARVGRLSLYCRASEEDAAQMEGHPDLALYERIHIHRLPRKVYADVFKVFSEESMKVWMAQEDQDDPLGQQLCASHQRDPLDVLVCHQLFSASVARGCGIPWVLDAHEIVHVGLSEMHRAQRSADTALATEQWQQVRDFEGKAMRETSLVVSVTQADADVVGRMGQPAVCVIRNGVAAHEIPYTPPSQRTTLDVLFTGAFFWPPNGKAARFLAKEVMPRVWQMEPAARLVLCGRSPGADVVFLQRRGIEVTGTVSSMQPFLDRAAVYANALFEGSGSSLKVLEALASGIPLISTAVGVRGYPLLPGREYVSAEDADGFARAIIDQFRDRAAADERARAGRAVAEQYDWAPIGREFAAAVSSVARRGIDQRRSI
jgi:glycosyltransferase involved in cell wall biosynthesis